MAAPEDAVASRGAGPVVVLAGGTGGARLARGLYDLVGDRLVVVANTGDDVEIYGAWVSPDPDLCTYWLADRIDERGWGLEGDTFVAMDGLRELGHDIWFSLGDRDLAFCLDRAQRHAAGDRLTDIHADLTTALGVRARVLPMSDDPVRTHVRTGGTWIDVQRFLIAHAGAAIDGVRFDGAPRASITDDVRTAIADASVIIIGPSNPVLSIGPILAVPGIADALRAAAAPVVAVSPIVGGKVLKGPTAACMTHAGVPCTAAGIAELYGDLLDGIVSDDSVVPDGLPALVTSTMLDTPAARTSVATAVLDFATSRP